MNETEKNCAEKIKEMKIKVEEAEKISHEKELESTQISSDFQREKVLMEQKIIFLEKTLKELDNHKLRSNLNSSVSSNSNKNKNDEMSTKQKKEKLEEEIKRLNKSISKLEKNVEELSNELYYLKNEE